MGGMRNLGFGHPKSIEAWFDLLRASSDSSLEDDIDFFSNEGSLLS